MENINELILRSVEQMGVAATLIDTEGILLYYNRHAEKILDRKPEYIGQDLHSHHKKPATNERFDAMMLAFEEGQTEPFRYEASPYEKVLLVTLSPIHEDGAFMGALQTVMLKEEILPVNPG